MFEEILQRIVEETGGGALSSSSWQSPGNESDGGGIAGARPRGDGAGETSTSTLRHAARTATECVLTTAGAQPAMPPRQLPRPVRIGARPAAAAATDFAKPGHAYSMTASICEEQSKFEVVQSGVAMKC